VTKHTGLHGGIWHCYCAENQLVFCSSDAGVMAPGQGAIGHVAGSIQGFIQVGSFFALKFKLALESPSYPFNFSQP